MGQDVLFDIRDSLDMTQEVSLDITSWLDIVVPPPTVDVSQPVAPVEDCAVS